MLKYNRFYQKYMGINLNYPNLIVWFDCLEVLNERLNSNLKFLSSRNHQPNKLETYIHAIKNNFEVISEFAEKYEETPIDSCDDSINLRLAQLIKLALAIKDQQFYTFKEYLTCVEKFSSKLNKDLKFIKKKTKQDGVTLEY